MTGSLAQLAREQAAACAEKLDDARGAAGTPAHAGAVAEAVALLKSTPDNEGCAIEIIAWAVHADEARRQTAVDVIKAARDAVLLRMLVARLQRPAEAPQAADALQRLTGRPPTDAAAWETWVREGGRPW